MVLYMHFGAHEAHLFLAWSAVVVGVDDEFGIVLFFGEVGVGAGGTGEIFLGCIFDEGW